MQMTRMANRIGRILPLAPLALVIGVFFLYPVGSLLSLSFVGPDRTLSIEHYREVFRSEVYLQLVLYTLYVSAVVTVVSVLVAYPLCVYMGKLSLAGRRKVILFVLIPFWTSFLIRTFAWIVILARTGFVNDLLVTLSVTSGPIQLMYNSLGLIVGMVHALLPLAILTMLPVIYEIDPQYQRAGSVMGASGAQVFWRIFFPLSFPGISAAAVLVFVTSLGFFITPALLGGAGQTMISQVIIRQVQELLNWSFAGALSVLLLAATLIVLGIYGRVFGLSSLIGASGGKATDRAASGAAGVRMLGALGRVSDGLGRLLRIRPFLARHGSRVLAAVTGLVMAFLMLPILVLVPISVTRTSLLAWPPVGFSWRWYETLVSSRDWIESASASFAIGIAVGLSAVVVGTAAAFVIIRVPFRGKGLLLSLAIAPLIIPRIIIGVALMYFFARLQLIDTYTGLILGHLVLAVPYVLITVLAVLRDYNIALDHAAWTLGAHRAATFRKVTFPLIRPALLTAFVFAFITSFDDVTISLFLSGSDVVTLPKKMWLDAFLDVTPVLAAVSTISIVVISVFLIGAEVLRSRSAGR